MWYIVLISIEINRTSIPYTTRAAGPWRPVCLREISKAALWDKLSYLCQSVYTTGQLITVTYLLTIYLYTLFYNIVCHPFQYHFVIARAATCCQSLEIKGSC